MKNKYFCKIARTGNLINHFGHKLFKKFQTIFGLFRQFFSTKAKYPTPIGQHFADIKLWPLSCLRFCHSLWSIFSLIWG